jgi:hypothetical protein
MQIFVSYRRSDSEDVAGRLYDYLERRVGSESVFKDVDSIPFGADFRQAVREAIHRSDLTLAIIGPEWLPAKDESQRRRLDNPSDWVRIEIETALQANLRLVPVLLGSTPMPDANELPKSLQELAFRNAARLRPDPDFRKDVERLCQDLGLPEPSGSSAPSKLKSLHVSSSTDGDEHVIFKYTLLFGSPEAIVPVSEQRINRRILRELYTRISETVGFVDIGRLGAEFAALVFPPSTVDLLTLDPDVHLVVFHDKIAGQVPWEIVRVGETFPALRAGLSRRFLSDQQFLKRPAYSTKTADRERVLIVANPTEDLYGTIEEAEKISAVISSRFPNVRIESLLGKNATKASFLERLKEGDFGLVHFAGHGFYDNANPEKSGILLAQNEVVRSEDLIGAIPHPPQLVFISAAEIAQLSGSNDISVVSPAEALLGSGVQNFISASWPEGDLAAAHFVSRFYDTLFRGSTFGTAVREARMCLWEKKEKDCFNYVHFGLPENVLLLEE